MQSDEPGHFKSKSVQGGGETDAETRLLAGTVSARDESVSENVNFCHFNSWSKKKINQTLITTAAVILIWTVAAIEPTVALRSPGDAAQAILAPEIPF